MKRSQKIKNKEPQLDYRILTFISIGVITMLYFLCVGERGYIETSDSVCYYTLDVYNAIRPIYPIFLFAHKIVFGEGVFLKVALLSQTVIMIGCSAIFSLYVKKEFKLTTPVTMFIYLISFLAYTLVFPHAILNHYIWTEAIAYPLFYIYMMYLLKTIYTGGWRDVCGNIVITLVLSLTRSQLQLLWVLSASTLVYVVGKAIASRLKSKVKYITIPIVLLLTFVSISIGGVLLSVEITGRYHDVIRYIKSQTENVKSETSVEIDNTTSIGLVRGDDITSSQYQHVILSKAAYVAKKEDVNLFKTKEMQETYLSWYESLEEAGFLSHQKPDDMKQWEHFVYATEKVANGHYNMVNYTDESLDIVKKEIIISVLQANGLELVGHTVGLMMQGMVTAIIQERDAFYGIDIYMALFMYLSAIGMAIYLFVNKNSDKKVPVFMIVVMAVTCGMVGATTILFINEQRYLYYAFGVFAIAYFMQGIEVYKCYLLRRFEQ